MILENSIKIIDRFQENSSIKEEKEMIIDQQTFTKPEETKKSDVNEKLFENIHLPSSDEVEKQTENVVRK